MKTLVVNLLGGPSVGKSTFAADIFSQLKWNKVECEIASEYAKDLVWEERHETFKDQIYIFGKQHHRIFRLLDKVRVIITDCPIILSPIYDPDKRETFEKLVFEEFNKMTNLNFFLLRKKDYNPNGRIHDETQAKEIDQKILDLLNKHHVVFYIIEGSREGAKNAVNMIKAIIDYNYHL